MRRRASHLRRAAWQQRRLSELGLAAEGSGEVAVAAGVGLFRFKVEEAAQTIPFHGARRHPARRSVR